MLKTIPLLLLLIWSCVAAPPPAENSRERQTTDSNRSGSLKGEVVLNPETDADRFKLKLKRDPEVVREFQGKKGEPFRIDSLSPGIYDLVVEANGHSTFVKPDFVSIKAGETTPVRVEMVKAATVFADGEATKIILCSACHKKIYMEMIRGVGIDDFYSGPWPGPDGKLIHLPDLARDFYENSAPEHLAYVSPITVAAIAKEPVEKQDGCRRCHAPTVIHVGKERPAAPALRDKNREDGVSCVSCHLDKDGNILGKYDVSAPHATVQDPLFTPARSAELCAACHQADDMAPEYQTVSEWKTDFAKNDPRTCRDCHMPQTTRRLSEIFSDRPERAIGKHLFAGGHSLSMLKKGATINIEKDPFDPKSVRIAVTNQGAGHSFPTGYGPRALLVHLRVTGPEGTSLIDTAGKEPLALFTVDPALGTPSEQVRPALRAGTTERIPVQIGSEPGKYVIKAMLYYDLDRLVHFNDQELPLVASAEETLQIEPAMQ